MSEISNIFLLILMIQTEDKKIPKFLSKNGIRISTIKRNMLIKSVSIIKLLPCRN